MKTYRTLVLLTALILWCQMGFSQASLLIPYGATPTIDGGISTGEWMEAGQVEIALSSNTKKVKVWFMHDSFSLFVAFLGHLESSNIRFPEILLDIHHDKSASWLTDDWWFHVSATDCAHQGQYAVYDDCQLVQLDWTAESNFAPMLPKTDTVEVQIPFSTIGIDLQQTDSIGLAFLVTNTVNAWEYWPVNAQKLVPASWASAVLSRNTTVGTTAPAVKNPFRAFPNPSTGIVYVPEGSNVSVFDSGGQLRLSKSNVDSFDISGLPNGVYVLRVVASGSVSFQRLLLIKS